MPASLVLQTSNAAFAKSVLRAVAAKLTKVLGRATPLIKRDLGVVVVELIQHTDVYKSLMGGGLRGHMGLEHPEQVLPVVLDVIARDVFAEIDPIRIVGDRLQGGVRFGIIKSDYSDVLGVPGTTYVSPPSGRSIDWLEWMLTAGDQKVIMNHGIRFDLTADEQSHSRSGMALMFPEDGYAWGVPEYASGTAGDNWLTRAFEFPGVDRLVAAVVKKRFREVM